MVREEGELGTVAKMDGTDEVEKAASGSEQEEVESEEDEHDCE